MLPGKHPIFLFAEKNTMHIFFLLHLRFIWSRVYIFFSNMIYFTPLSLACKSAQHPDLLCMDNVCIYWTFFFKYLFCPALMPPLLYLITSELFADLMSTLVSCTSYHHPNASPLCCILCLFFQGLCYHTMSAVPSTLSTWGAGSIWPYLSLYFWKQGLPKWYKVVAALVSQREHVLLGKHTAL